MSCELVETALPGYSTGPIWLHATRELMELLESSPDGFNVSSVADQVGGENIETPVTQDGYEWLGGIELLMDETRVAVLIPKFGDDGGFERALVVYFDDPPVLFSTLEKEVEKITAAFRDLFEWASNELDI